MSKYVGMFEFMYMNIHTRIPIYIALKNYYCSLNSAHTELKYTRPYDRYMMRHPLPAVVPTLCT